MPTLPEGLGHNYIKDTALPYISNQSLTDEGRSYIDGSNVVTTIKGTLERRPGFPVYTADNFGANNTILRYSYWQRWDGVYIVMVNVTDSGANTSKVYKQQIGTDTTFQLIKTSTSNVQPFFFVVAHNFVFFGNGNTGDMWKYDGTTVTIWGTATPTAAPGIANTSAGNVPGTIGHTWTYAFENSATGLLSDLSLASASSSAANRKWTISGSNTTDTQIDKIHVYRTEDGGSIWKEVSNSPIAYANGWSFVDNDADTSLKSTQAPLVGINAPPPAAYPSEQLYASRIFVWKNDTMYWSSLEEANNQGMFEEGFPVNNKRRFGRQITRVAVVGGVLLIYTVSGIFTLTGSSLVTFQWGTLSRKRGLRNPQALATDGELCVWLDLSNQVLGTDGATITNPDISLPIRPDISSIVHGSASIAIHTIGKRNYILLADGGASKIRVYDLDKRQWMPPWALANSAIGTVETASGTWSLLIGSTALPLKMDETGAVFQDNGSSYTAFVKVGLLPIVPTALGGGNPADTGILYYVDTERDSGSTFANVQYLLDDDTAQAGYVDLAAISGNPKRPLNRKNVGTYLIDEWWMTGIQTAARRVGVQFNWAAANSNFILYSFDPAYTRFLS